MHKTHAKPVAFIKSERRKGERYLLRELPKGRLQLGEHAIKGYQQHLTRGHLRRLLALSVHAARLDQLRILGAQDPENTN